MSDRPADQKARPAWQRPASGTAKIDASDRFSPPREREISGIDPFVELRYRRRGRSISRVVTVRIKPTVEGISAAFEVFFAVG
jgi:hypothetical protein